MVNRLWPISDLDVIGKVTAAMADKAVYIADGHHRYETGLKYLEDTRSAGEVANDEAAPNFIMMMLVGMSDPGLQILPTHRLISGLPDGYSAEKLAEVLAPHFELERIGTGDAAGAELWDLIEADGSQSVLGFGTVADGVWQMARLKSGDRMAELAGTKSEAWRGLAVSVLHVLVLGDLLKQHSPECRFVHLLSEVNETASAKACQLSALVPPATMEHVRNIAGSGEKMPPKSTYFFPKLLTGLVFNSLKGN